MKSAVLASASCVDYTQSGIHLVCYRVSLLRNVPTFLGSMEGKLPRGKHLPPAAAQDQDYRVPGLINMCCINF